ncbi:MAG TPA: bifunctional riboflavin kinase/FAD synthetase [Steroidobacteraceae bacterium]|nr:bifunctional riboflavin kinase/FAD synthetase [Steroidobacteraceae bacterium]
MQLIRGVTGFRGHSAGCALTIGTYDGIHLGHQALIARLREHAVRLGTASVLLTFEPTPREYLLPSDPPARLTSLRERWRILCALGVDYLWLLRFGEALRNLSAEDFAQLLVRELEPRIVVVGHDFRFARRGEATATVLAEAGQRLGFGVDVLPAVALDGERVSSSGVRAALARSDFDSARRWLGRPWSMRGRVQPGRSLGVQLGFPTANVPLERRRSPVAGIFAVRVRGAGNGERNGVASLGTRPTIGGTEALLEAHVFDFEGDLYGREIEVEFVARLRDEERFASLEALSRQMELDAAEARRILNS